MTIYSRPVVPLCLFFMMALQAVAQKPITPETALKSYLNSSDKTYRWEIKDTQIIDDVMVYNVLLTSQKWREHIWTHQLSIMVPKERKYDGALLFITGGSINKEGQPNWSSKEDQTIKGFSLMAKTNNAVVALLKQTPNQPLYNGLTEDALISYTLHNFRKDGDYTWPLLFPMVKSATAAMDAIQELAQQKLKHKVGYFVVSGASKRGWTTWLAGAIDKRVTAIAPMVIDMLNMPVSMSYQIKVWKDYSIQIEDYVKLGLVQDVGTASSNTLVTMIDPYAYRKALAMPKMIIMGTNDEYWPIDNIKNYLDSIPGKNLLHYVANVGHGLGDGNEAMSTLSAFFGNTLSRSPQPVCSWTTAATAKGLEVTIKATGDKLLDVVVWHATSPDMDFRNDKWQSTSLGISKKSKFIVTEAYPSSGYMAFYVSLKYQGANGLEYSQCTRVFMTDDKKLL